MKFQPDKRRNPLDSWPLGVAVHAVSLGGAGLAVYWSLVDHSLLPLGLAFLVLSGLEGLWMYYGTRR
ncbi:hypothetical protein ACS5PN_01505 [Roseateles sp. NT4]|uniref:hypothetical protein n=1 Tax=Roseateles sp. NT4 TaxID=3453715 RepID=UPI003EEE941A